MDTITPCSHHASQRKARKPDLNVLRLYMNYSWIGGSMSEYQLAWKGQLRNILAKLHTITRKTWFSCNTIAWCYKRELSWDTSLITKQGKNSIYQLWLVCWRKRYTYPTRWDTIDWLLMECSHHHKRKCGSVRLLNTCIKTTRSRNLSCSHRFSGEPLLSCPYSCD